MARRLGLALLMAAVGSAGCAHGQPSESASNADADTEINVDAEPGEAASQDSAPSDGPKDSTPADVASEPAVDAPPCNADLIINEVQTAGASDDDEFGELHNPASCAVLLDGYELMYRSSEGTADVLVWSAVPGQKMLPGQFFILGGAGFPTAPDFPFPTQVALGAGGGGLGLLKNGTPVDRVGWGDASNAYLESTAAAAPAAGKSIGRLPDGHDTDDNSSDFIEATATPRKPNSPL